MHPNNASQWISQARSYLVRTVHLTDISNSNSINITLEAQRNSFSYMCKMRSNQRNSRSVTHKCICIRYQGRILNRPTFRRDLYQQPLGTPTISTKYKTKHLVVEVELLERWGGWGLRVIPLNNKKKLNINDEFICARHSRF